jgi:CHASE2 domain-containing sensor protein
MQVALTGPSERRTAKSEDQQGPEVQARYKNAEARRLERERQKVAGTSRWMVFLYLLFSFFSALLFSILLWRARDKGRAGIGWIVLTLLASGMFGTISYSLVHTSSPAHDAGWYYLGLSALVANGLALLILFLALFLKRS